MTSTPDRRLRAGLALAALALAASPGGAADGASAAMLRQADVALGRGDGIAAEMALRKAMAAGAPRGAVAARMGEAYVDQDNRAKAREWLVPGLFDPGEALRGFRLLGQIELADGNLPAAGKAFDRALALAPRDGGLWLDIARLRYAGGEHLESIAAAEEAVRLEPESARTIGYRALLVRDRYGLAAALPWLEAGLKRHPDDLALLAEYAGTLGDMGRARDALVITRRILELDRGNGRAFYLQAVMAARAGDESLARQLLGRAGKQFGATPGALLLQGVLELRAGNANTAAEVLGRLSMLQPQNRTARNLLAKAVAAGGNPRAMIETFAAEAQRADASPWLMTLVARAYEDLGQRDLAAPLLDRAARGGGSGVIVLAGGAPAGVLATRYAEAPALLDAAVPLVRQLLSESRTVEARQIAERQVQAHPGSADAQLLAGDVRLAAGDLTAALDAYRIAAAVRLNDDLLLRLVDVYARTGRPEEAVRLIDTLHSASPRNRIVLRLAADLAARRGDWAQATRLLGWLDKTGPGDARLSAELAAAARRSGNMALAREAALGAFRQQPASPVSNRAMALIRPRGPFSEWADSLTR